jgi:very-short-patch-repair endonuclease
MAAVLSCGRDAALSHDDSAALWGIRPFRGGTINVSVPTGTRARRPGIVVHRRKKVDVTERHGIPVTAPIDTLIDLASQLDRDELEAAINEADKRDLVNPEELRTALDSLAPRPGVGILRETLDRRTFTMTDSSLERLFLPIARRVGLSKPETGQWVNGYKVDFYWPDLGLVVETDGLRYHRTPAQQAADRRRDQAHAAAGLTSLRFTRAQVKYEPAHVQETLATVSNRLLSRHVSWQTPRIEA